MRRSFLSMAVSRPAADGSGIETIHPTNQKCADIARHSYEAGLKACGRRHFQDICGSHGPPSEGGRGVEPEAPLIHSLSPPPFGQSHEIRIRTAA